MDNKVRVIEHHWLDMSVSYFIEVNGKRQAGEISSSIIANESARKLAKSIGAKFIETQKVTNELFS